MNKYFPKIFSSFTLKIISTVLFITGRGLIEFYFSKADVMYKVGNVMVYMALPIFCFLAVEGFKHTKKVSNYIIRLFVVGIITELIIDYGMFGTDFSKYYKGNNLNIFISLAIGVVMVTGLEFLAKTFRYHPVWKNLTTILCFIIFTALAEFIGAEYAGGSILTMASMYIFYGNPFLIMIAIAAMQIAVLGSAASVIMYAPIVGAIFTWFYSGKRGYQSTVSRIVFYAIYPITYFIITMLIKAQL